MKLNSSKPALLCITKKTVPLIFSYSIGQDPLIEVKEYKYLGVTITNNLNWSTHISNTASSAFRKLCLLRHKLKHASHDVKTLAYTTFIRPKLEYASIIWDPFTKTNINCLERIQRKAMRFIFSKCSRNDSVTELLHSKGFKPLQMRHKISRLKFLHSFFNGEFLADATRYINLSETRKTRHSHSLTLSPYLARTVLSKHSFFPRTIEE